MENGQGERELRERYEALTDGERKEYSLISLKIKRFRVFSRLYGWETGDALLEKVYELLCGWLGEGDRAAYARLNSYTLLLRFPRDWEEISQKMIEINSRIRDMDDPRFPCKVFCGFGVYPLEPGVDLRTAQYNADMARAQCPERDFRNSHFQVYGVNYTDTELRYYDLAELVRPALERGDIQVYLQPKVDLRTGEVRSAEALMRWQDPERGMIPPSEFLPVLEESGVIDLADLCLFEQCCKTIDRWTAAYGKQIQISVNLSASMFNYEYFMEQYQEARRNYSTPAGCLQFELLESIVLNQTDRVRTVVDELKRCGFSCALDDFGSGYSSYGVLANSEISVLKIDRSLFRREGDPRERTIIRHIVETAHELGMRTVAEGVETPGYVEFLRDLGCDYVQGFVFYRPMPVDEFEERFLRRGERAKLPPR